MANFTFYDLNSINLEKIGAQENKIFWPSSVYVYSDIGQYLNEAFYKVINNNNLDENTKLSFIFSFSEIIIYAEKICKIIIDIENNNRKGIKFVFNSNSSPLFNIICSNNKLSETTDIFNIFLDKYFQNFYPNDGFSTWLKRQVSILNMCVFNSKKHYDIHNQNFMMDEYIQKTKAKVSLLRPELWKWPSSVNKNSSVDELANFLTLILQKYLEKFTDNNIQMNNGLIYFKTISSFKINSILGKFLFLKNSNIHHILSGSLIGGTPKAMGKILNFYYQRYGKDVCRFSHGGDRMFFKDINWKMSELLFTKKYFCHSSFEANFQNEKYQYEINNCSLIKNLSFCSNGSIRHKNIWQKNNFYRKVNIKKRVLIIAGSFLGEHLMGFSQFKLADILSLDLLIYTYNVLTNNNFDVFIKPHPKGIAKDFFKLNQNNLNIYNNALNEFDDHFDCYVFEFAGSAFYDALLTNKGVVLLDTNIRKWYNPAKKHLVKRCKIIKTYSDNKNWLRFNEIELIDAVLSSSETKNCDETYAQTLYD